MKGEKKWGINQQKEEPKGNEMSKTKTATNGRTKTKTATKTTTNKEEKTMSPTMENDQIDLSEAEDFKLPSTGVHLGNLAGVELAVTKKNENKDQFIITVTLASDDPDAPNLPLRKYLGWPLPEEKNVFWGTRTAYGSQVQSIKETMTAFGGQESGAMTKDKTLAFLQGKVGMVVKVKVKLEARKDQVTGEPLVPAEYQANVDKLLPA